MAYGSKIQIKTGTEGPESDPYGYTEYRFIRMHPGNKTVEIVYHSGLVVWMVIEISLQPTWIVKAPDDADDKWYEDTFKYYTGVTPDQAQQIYYKLRYRCSCGCKRTKMESGYPGETLNVCIRCGKVVSTDFNEGAIL